MLLPFIKAILTGTLLFSEATSVPYHLAALIFFFTDTEAQHHPKQFNHKCRKQIYTYTRVRMPTVSEAKFTHRAFHASSSTALTSAQPTYSSTSKASLPFSSSSYWIFNAIADILGPCLHHIPLWLHLLSRTKQWDKAQAIKAQILP